MVITIVFIILIAASAFFSASETALFSLTDVKVETLRKDKDRRGLVVARLLSKPSTLLITILIGNMAVNILASSISADFSTRMFGATGLVISIAVTWFAILIFGEITPKIIAVRRNIATALFVSPALRVFSVICYPLRQIMRLVTTGVLRLLGQETARAKRGLTKSELKTAFKLGHSEGHLDKLEEKILSRIMDFDTKSVTSAMTPRGEIISCDMAEGAEGVKRLVKQNRFSRIPVYEDDPENIIGIAYAKDLATSPEVAEKDFRSLLRPVLFVPEQQKMGRLFFNLRKERTRMAMIVDEYGSLEGLATVHDLLERVVGEVPQPGEEPEHRKIGPKAWLVKASMTVGNFEDIFEAAIPEGDYDTMGGFVINEKGELPEPGESLFVGEYEIIVHQREESRILWLRVEKGVEIAED